MADAGKEVDGPPPVLFQVCVEMDCVIDASFLALELGEDSIKTAIVSVPRGQEALRCPCVAPAAKWCDEGGQVAVGNTQRNAVVTVPGICHGLPSVLGDATGELEGRLHGKGLTLAKFVQWRDVYSAAWRAVVLSCDDHPVTPRNGFAVRHTLDDAKGFVAEEVIVHPLLPVEGYVGRCMAGLRCGCGVNMYLYGWSLHTG